MTLTPKQLKHLEARLLEERTRVMDALARYNRETRAALQEQSGDVSAFHVHMADQGTDTEDQEIDAINAARETVELAEIDAALERLYQGPGEYGRCERTGKPIPFKRLDLVPWARTCD
ncbi:MAG TPA: TraR/DksA family transcriptional regulator [Gemmatimonadales bacterium]|nr:TraR/DksA family transcriptional regulator [Gemmatimonadales bacterium]